jgi:hypothetical protein
VRRRLSRARPLQTAVIPVRQNRGSGTPRGSLAAQGPGANRATWPTFLAQTVVEVNPDCTLAKDARVNDALKCRKIIRDAGFEVGIRRKLQSSSLPAKRLSER